MNHPRALRYAPSVTAPIMETPVDTSPVPGLREQRRLRVLEVNREHLLDAAEEVFGDKGFQAATIKEIAERAEFSVGAVYGIVTSKEDLLVQTLNRRAVELLGATEELAASSSAGLAALLELADLQIEFFRRHPHFGRLWLRWGGGARWGLPQSSLAGMGADIGRAMAMQARIIERGQASGELRSGDANVLAHIFSGMIQSYQATDPASVGEAGEERLTLADLHELIAGAFATREEGAVAP